MVAVAGVAAMGCADKVQQGAGTANTAAALTAAGFTVVPANTPERQASLRQLPPQKFVRKLRGDKVVFIYADPANCNCAYVGNVTAYAAYQARTTRQVAAEQETVAMDNFDFAPWAFGYPSD